MNDGNPGGAVRLRSRPSEREFQRSAHEPEETILRNLRARAGLVALTPALERLIDGCE
jgi:hypothetical protein